MTAQVSQVVFNPETSKEALEVAETIRSEYVLHVEGTVVERGEGALMTIWQLVVLKYKQQK